MRIQTQVAIGVLCTLALTLVLTQAAIRETTRMERQQRRHWAAAIEAGAALYEANCRTCHGSRGEGVGQLGPPLANAKFFTDRLAEVGWQDTLKAYVIAASSHGRLMATRPMYAGNATTAVMPPWLDRYGGPLREDQIRDIAAFVINWKPTALGEVELVELVVPKTNAGDPQTISRGREVFRSHCAQCHLIAGANPPEKAAPELTHIATTARTRRAEMEMTAEAYIRESFLIPNAYVVEGFEPDKVGYHCGGLLSARQLDEVVAFLLTRR
ncbi:MAG: c-type cytochrome [Desulfosarcinaceae bacterium]|jgi:mono/diheme cytochrome c family protein